MLILSEISAYTFLKLGFLICQIFKDIAKDAKKTSSICQRSEVKNKIFVALTFVKINSRCSN